MAALSLAEVFDLLPIAGVDWDREDNNEYSGQGSGVGWEAELGPSLWVADMTFDASATAELKQVNALLRWLRATKQPFLLCDPTAVFPAADPSGLLLGSANVTLRAIGNRFVAPLQGLPAGYVLTPGDKMQIPYFGKHAFVEVARPVVAGANGQADVPVSPNLPLPVVAGMPVTLKRPACPVFIIPDGHSAGTARRHLTNGASLKVMEKRN